MKSAECSLTARSFQLDETLVKCTPKIHSEADGHLKLYIMLLTKLFLITYRWKGMYSWTVQWSRH